MSTEHNEYLLGELCEFTNGFAFKSSDYVPRSSDTIEVFRMGYIARGGGFKEDNTPVFIPRSYRKSLDKFKLSKGDIIIAMTDMKNNVAILANTARIRDDNRFVLNQRAGRIRVLRDDLLDPLFLYYYSNWTMHVEYLRARANSGVQVNLTTSAIREAELFLPRLPQQKAIASVLGALDDKIELNRRMNGTLEAMARAIFKSWFVDFDPVRAKMEGRQLVHMDAATAALFPNRLDPETGLPVGWGLATLLQCASLNPESWSRASAPKEIDYVDLANTKWGIFESTQSFLWRDAPSRAKRILRPGDTIVGTVRPGNGSYAFIGNDGLTGSTGFAVLRPNHSRVREFVYLAATSPDNIERLAHLADGAAYPAVRPEVVGATEVVLPDDKILGRFRELAASLLDRIEASKRENHALAELRDALRPKLMLGEVRVRDAEKEGGAAM